MRLTASCNELLGYDYISGGLQTSTAQSSLEVCQARQADFPITVRTHREQPYTHVPNSPSQISERSGVQ